MECDEQQVDPQPVTEPEIETDDVADSNTDNDANDELTNTENEGEENNEDEAESDQENNVDSDTENNDETNTQEAEPEEETEESKTKKTSSLDDKKKIKKQLKHINRKLKPRPIVNKSDKRIDLFQFKKEAIISFQHHVEQGETYRGLQERCRSQARFHYYFRVEKFSFAREHAEKKPADHGIGKKYYCSISDTYFRTKAEYDKHLASNHYAELEILNSALEDVAVEFFLAKNVEGYVIDSSVLKLLEDGLVVNTHPGIYNKVWDPKFDITINNSTFKGIECEGKTLGEFIEDVYEKILIELTPENDDTNCEEEEKTSEESWCHFCRVYTGSKEDLIKHRATRQHSDFKSLKNKIHKKACAYWTTKNVPAEEEKERSETRLELLNKLGYSKNYQSKKQNKYDPKLRSKRGNPQRDINSGIANKRFRNQPQGPFRDPGYFPGYRGSEGRMDYQGPPGRQPPFMQRGPPPHPDMFGPPEPTGRYGGLPPRRQMGEPPSFLNDFDEGPSGGHFGRMEYHGQFDGPPRGQFDRQFDGPPRGQFDRQFDGPPRGPHGMPPRQFGPPMHDQGPPMHGEFPPRRPPPHMMSHQGGWNDGRGQRGFGQRFQEPNSREWKQNFRENQRNQRMIEEKKNSKLRMIEWQKERNRQRLSKQMEEKNEKARQAKAKKLEEENKKLMEANKKLIEENKKLAEGK